MKSKDVAIVILDRVGREKHILQPAIGRVELLLNESAKGETFWIIRRKRSSATTVIRDINGNIVDTLAGPEPFLEEENTTIVARDGKFGGSLIASTIGTNELINEHNHRLTADVFTLAKYNPIPLRDDAAQGIITTTEDSLKFADSLKEELQNLERLESDVKKLETELEDCRKTEEEKIDLHQRLDLKRRELRAQQEKVKKYRNRSNQLRGQAVLDPEQEDTKRCKIFDGGLIIDGGPGTGKTTSLIQRITFLTSPTIVEYKPELSEVDKKILFNDLTSWMFFSPSELLREYLRNAMDQEGLSADKHKVVVWDKFRSILFREFGFINPATGRPFQASTNHIRIFKGSGETVSRLIAEFESFHFQRQRSKIERMLNVDIDKVSWQSLGNSIRGAVSGFESLSSYEEWIRFYTRLKEEYREKAARISEEFRNGIQDLVDSTQAKFKRNEEQWKSFDEELHSRFEKKISSEVEDEEGEIEDVEEEEEALQGGLKYDYDVELNRLLRRLIRIGALSEYDRNTRFSKKAREDYNKVEPFIDKSFFAVIGEGALFRKYFDKLTRGVERSLMRDLSRSYKGFRRTVLLTSDLLTENGKRELAGFISAENKKVSEDEMELLLLCTCHTVHSLFRIDPTLFSNSAYPQIQGFRSHAKAVVAIDEATDFAPLQLACMASLSHPRFSCFTLSGDLMQRLNKNGLISWKEFTLLHPDTEIRKINISYRQTPKLLNIAKEIYRKQLGVEPDFNSDTTDGVGDPDALLFKHSLFETRVDWIAERIVEIHKIYGNSIPSIAIFFKNDSHMLEYAKELSRHESLMELDISVAACANGNVLGDPESVRLFAVEYIKGMEFEVVFFVDIDSIANEYPEMIDKYVYVGLSRANLYLAVTVQNEFPRALSYLEPMFSKQGTWLV